jgi:hypothetical protein
MIHSLCVSLPVFAELYLTFLKTNIGFVELVDDGVTKIMTFNFSIENKLKESILGKLKKMLMEPISNHKQLEALLKSCEFITKVANFAYKPNMRMYKFGSIVNFQYSEIQAKY